MSTNSTVQFPSANFTSSKSLEEHALPQGSKHLLQWTQRKYGFVTSFTELNKVNNIYIKVGEGESLLHRDCRKLSLICNDQCELFIIGSYLVIGMLV